DDQAGHARHRVPRAGLHRPAGRAALAQGPHLLRLLRLSQLQVRGLAAAGQRAVPEVRRGLRHRACAEKPHRPQLRARGMRLRAGGRARGDMKDSLAAFLRHLSLEKDASPHTLRSYRTDLLEFAQYAGTGDPSTWLGDVDTRTIRGYLAHLHARSLDAPPIARQLAAGRSWFRFLVRRGALARNVAREVRGPRPPRKLVSFLPIDEATALMGAKAPSAAARARDTAVLELLYATGLRVSELAGLD